MNASPDNPDAALREALKRCPPSTYEAARRFRVTGDCAELSVIIRGVIERFVRRDRHAQLHTAGPELRLLEDLGIDSLTMMEIVMLAEEALPITISNEELRHLRTLGEVEQFISSKLRGQPPPQASGSASWYLDDLAARKEPSPPPSAA
jgi:acyl carrier protein